MDLFGAYLLKMEKIIGVYKITNPKGRIYIGSSSNIRARFSSYKNLHCADQPKLYNSFVKYGIENHTFVIEKECEYDDLYKNEREIGEKYSVLKYGLNCALPTYADKKQAFSEEARLRISMSKRGNKNPQFGKVGILSTMFGKKKTPEQLINQSNALKGRTGKSGADHHMFGKKHTDEAIAKMLIANKRGANGRAKKVINIKTLKVYDCAADAAEYENVKYDWFKAKLNGTNKNTTDYIFLSEYNKMFD